MSGLESLPKYPIKFIFKHNSESLPKYPIKLIFKHNLFILISPSTKRQLALPSNCFPVYAPSAYTDKKKTAIARTEQRNTFETININSDVYFTKPTLSSLAIFALLLYIVEQTENNSETLIWHTNYKALIESLTLFQIAKVEMSSNCEIMNLGFYDCIL